MIEPNKKFIVKGKVSSLPSAPVEPVSYVISQRGKQRYALIKLNNKINKGVTAVKLKLTQYTAKRHRAVKASVITITDVQCNGSGEFVLNRYIEVGRYCGDIKVEVLVAYYDEFSYTLNSGSYELAYNQAASGEYDINKAYGETGGEKTKVKKHKFRLPVSAVILSVIFLLALCLSTVAYLHFFTRNSRIFRVDGVDYMFVSENSEKGDVVVAGYGGLNGQLHIPSIVGEHEVVGVAGNAFYENKRIKAVTFEKEMPVGDSAFYGCENLSSVQFDKVTSIGKAAFYGCKNLKRVRIDETTAAIGDDAFASSGVTDVNINVSPLTEIKYPEEGIKLGSRVFNQCSELTIVSLPEYISEIGVQTFGYCTSLTALSLPKCITYVPEYTFLGCSSLGRLPFEGSGEWVRGIGAGAFAGCSAFNSISVPSTVEIIGLGAFEGCNRIERVGLPFVGASNGAGEINGHLGYIFGATSSEDNAQVLPQALTSVTISEQLYLQARAFYGCEQLTEINLLSDMLAIGESAFDGCKKITKIRVPSTVKSIGALAFNQCKKLTSINIPSGATLGVQTFGGCYRLHEIRNYSNYDNEIFSNGTLGAYAVWVSSDPIAVIEKGGSGDYTYGKVGEKWYLINTTYEDGTVNLPNNFVYEGQTIYDYAIPAYFYTQTEVEQVNVSAAVSGIGEGAFMACQKLTSVSVSDNSRLTYLGASAFSGDVMLTSVTFGGGVGIDSIGKETFMGCAIKEISIPDSVQSISNRAFYANESLRSVVLPTSLQSIGEEAFSMCGKIREVLNPSALPISLGGMDNGNIAYYASVISTDKADKAAFIDYDGVTYMRAGSHGWYAVDCDDTVTQLNVRTFVQDGYVARDIKVARYAFMNKTKIYSVNLGSGVISVGEQAFIGCNQATTVDMSQSNVSVIDVDAFNGCTLINSLVFSNELTTIGERAFYRCDNVTKLILPATLGSVGAQAFADCYNVKSLSFASAFTMSEDSFSGVTPTTIYDGGGYSLRVGGSELNGIAVNADVVYPFSEGRVPMVTVDGNVFAQYNGVWTLFRYGANDNQYIQELPERVVSGGYDINVYAVARDAFYMRTVQSLVVPTAVTTLTADAFSGGNAPWIIYYGGTDVRGWQTVCQNSFASTVYTYVDCVHAYGNNQWARYNGAVSTGVWSRIDTVTEPTCTQEGLNHEVCMRCEEVLREIPISPHGHNYNYEYKAVTCTEDGYERERCTICNDIRNETIYPATGHELEQRGEPPTCTESGWTQKYCVVCGHEQEKVTVPATGHDYDEHGECACGAVKPNEEER